MTKRIYSEIIIPFAGFYESKWDDLISGSEEREVEYFEERQKEDGIPEYMRLTADEYGDILNRHSQYSFGQNKIARDYVELFNVQFKELTGIELGLTYKTLDSPKYYNFETDKIVANIPHSSMRKLVKAAKAIPEEFAEHIEERHKSRSGFISFYSWDFAEWQAKHWYDFDHNEMQTVLETVMAHAFAESGQDDSEFEWSIYYPMAESDYEYFEASFVWSDIEAAVKEAQEEKAAEHMAEMLEYNPDYVPPYRCSETPDLFAN